MTDAHAALAAKAEAARPGPWRVYESMQADTFVLVGEKGLMAADVIAGPTYERRNAEYIAAASPDVVLGLIRDLADANARIEAALKASNPARVTLDWPDQMDDVRRILSAPAADAHPEVWAASRGDGWTFFRVDGRIVADGPNGRDGRSWPDLDAALIATHPEPPTKATTVIERPGLVMPIYEEPEPPTEALAAWRKWVSGVVVNGKPFDANHEEYGIAMGAFYAAWHRVPATLPPNVTPKEQS